MENTGRDISDQKFRVTVPNPHMQSANVIAQQLGVDLSLGRTDESVESARGVYGHNRLDEPPQRPAWLRFVDQFRSGIVYILTGAALLSLIVGDIKDPIIIGIVLFFNGLFGFWQEGKASKSLQALQKFLVDQVRVRRNGEIIEIKASEIVPGDIVILESGDRVPADGRLITAALLSVDESVLTGESLPVNKDIESIEHEELPLGDMVNMLFSNTVVVRGRAEMIVTSTGMQTQVGHIANMLSQEEDELTPLQKQLDKLGKQLSMVAGIAVLIVFVLQLLQGRDFAEAALAAVALAVAAIPEGLPAVVTVTLAVGVRQMSKRNAIVKRLASVETLGATAVICSDKTGTLTLNQMTVTHLVEGTSKYTISGQGYGTVGEITLEEDAGQAPSIVTAESNPVLELFLTSAVLCNDANLVEETVVGDPMEGALLVAAAKAGISLSNVRNNCPRVAEIPFDSAHKFMATMHQLQDIKSHVNAEIHDEFQSLVQIHEQEDNQRLFVALKGAPDVLLSRCTKQFTSNGLHALDDASIEVLHGKNSELGAKGLRVLAIAVTSISTSQDSIDTTRLEHDDMQDLIFIGLIGILDPPREEVKAALVACNEAGIDVKMITGDHPGTAKAIADALGITGKVVTGKDLDSFTDEELAEQIPGIGVCARVAPEHKVRVVSALQSHGQLVAMTGDGVNDAAALRRADMGVAMGITGTDVTKDAGDMVLADDNFATIVSAVERGRIVYDNIVKFVRFQLTTNMAAIFTIIVASILSIPAPFTAIQLLWINIICDGPPAMSLGVDPADRSVMKHKPRDQNELLLTRGRMMRILRSAVVMGVLTLGIYYWADSHYGEHIAATMTFTVFVFLQLANVINARFEKDSAFQRALFKNKQSWAAIIAVGLLQVVAVRWEWLRNIFDNEFLNWKQLLLCGIVSFGIVVADEIFKFINRLLDRKI